MGLERHLQWIPLPAPIDSRSTSVTLIGAQMRAAAILGLGCSRKNLEPFQSEPCVEWLMGLPASGDQADVVLLFGGDGTVHRHLGQLVPLKLPVLVVPAGSGNDLACSLGLCRVRDSLRAWRSFCRGKGNVRQIDLGVLNSAEAGEGPSTDAHRSAQPHTAYFSSVAGVGLDGEVARRANNLPRWLRGHGGYVLSLAPTIFTFAALPMRVFTADDGSATWALRSQRPTLLAAFANTPRYGGGMRIAPQAKVDDGFLDVCLVGSIDPFRLFCLFPAVYTGRHLGIKEVEYFKTSRVRIATECPMDVYADGEFVCRTPVDVGVERAALKVITLP